MTKKHQTKTIVLGLFGVISLTLAGCSFNNAPNPTVQVNVNQSGANNDVTAYVYEINQCDELPWFADTATTPTTEPEAVVDWLTSKGIAVAVSDIAVTEPAEGMAFCSACGCPTGRSIKLTADGSISEALLALGWRYEAKSDAAIEAEESDGDETLRSDQVTEQAVADADKAVQATQVTEATTTTEAVPTEDDPAAVAYDEDLRTRSTDIQASIRAYFEKNGHYPATFEEIDNQLVSTAGMTYTPIGTLPAEYYDLVVSYSSGDEVLNP